MYQVGDAVIDVEAERGQNALRDAYTRGQPISCVCRSPSPPMYIAFVNGLFIVKRMPETGHMHAYHCPHFEAPESLSGMQNLSRAIKNGGNERVLSLDFPLSVAGSRSASIISSSCKKTVVKDKPAKMTMSALLQFLWSEAGLSHWHPGFANKRSWGLVRHKLLEAAQGLAAKGHPLIDHLFIPEPFNLEKKDELFIRHRARLQEVSPALEKPQPLGLMIAEFKSFEETAHGAKLSVKHAPGLAFFASLDFSAQFKSVILPELQMVEMLEHSKLIVMATFVMTKKGSIVGKFEIVR